MIFRRRILCCENDEKLVGAMSKEERDQFSSWLDRLEAEMSKAGDPYGAGKVEDATGLECWVDCFRDGTSPKDALQEDLSHGE